MLIARSLLLDIKCQTFIYKFKFPQNYALQSYKNNNKDERKGFPAIKYFLTQYANI